MNDITETPIDELLKVVDEYRERECHAIREAARTQAADIVTNAHRIARERLHAAVLSERKRMQERVETARVQLETEQREHARQAKGALLREAWAHLAELVRKRWQDPDARRQWLSALVELGVKLLPHASWQVRHPQDWDPSDQTWLAEKLLAGTGQPPTFAPDANIIAGVRFEVDGATLDGTLEGILADRAATESLLLSEAEKL